MDNSAQRDFWSDSVGQIWIDARETMDTALTPELDAVQDWSAFSAGGKGKSRGLCCASSIYSQIANDPTAEVFTSASVSNRAGALAPGASAASSRSETHGRISIDSNDQPFSPKIRRTVRARGSIGQCHNRFMSLALILFAAREKMNAEKPLRAPSSYASSRPT